MKKRNIEGKMFYQTYFETKTNDWKTRNWNIEKIYIYREKINKRN